MAEAQLRDVDHIALHTRSHDQIDYMLCLYLNTFGDSHYSFVRLASKNGSIRKGLELNILRTSTTFNPRRLAISSGRRCDSKASNVAFTTLIGFVEPRTFPRMSCIPAQRQSSKMYGFVLIP